MKHASSSRNIRSLGIALATFGILGQSAAHAAPYYLDADGDTPGFQATNGSTYQLSDNFWSTSSSGSGALAPFLRAQGSVITIGNVSTDFAGQSFNIGTDIAGSGVFSGIQINSGSAVVTLIGAANIYVDNNSTWSVAAGSTLNQDNTLSAHPGMNFASAPLTLTGGGTINFNKMLGFNSATGRVTQNGSVTVNLKAASGSTDTFGGGYTLTSGTLNFATAAASNAFGYFNTAGRSFDLNGGTLDNTSGSAMTLAVGSAGYSIGGDFTFTGSNDLSLGTANVALTGTRQISVTANNLTVGGIISESASGYGLTKAGSGTLTLSGTNTYTGVTQVNAGSLVINGAVASTSVVVNGTLGGSGVMANATLSGSGSINPGNSPGILTASATDPSGGLDFSFEFTTAAAPTWSNAAASVNDVLRLTAATPFTAGLTGDNIVSVYFNVGSLTSGDVFTGGFYTDSSVDFLSSISGANFAYYLATVDGSVSYNGTDYDLYTGPLAINFGTMQVGSADFAGGTITNGYSTQFTVIPEPSTTALVGGLGMLALLRRRR